MRIWIRSACLALMLVAGSCGRPESTRLPVGGRVAQRDQAVVATPVRTASYLPEPEDSWRKPLRLARRRVALNGRSINLSLPHDFTIVPAMQGLKRIRFMATSPDGRLFITDMYDKTDNRKGAIYVLEGWDRGTKHFSAARPWLTELRNPNSIAFYTTPDGTTWLYVALTQALIRFRYTAGEAAPTAPADTIARFPDYGLSYKYGGWHLTRTVSVGPTGKLYVSVGSSCDACEEKPDEVRAAILEMNPDGTNARTIATGLRNAVGMTWIGETLFVTNMGSDFLGDDKPMETVYGIQAGKNYGWPYYYQYRAKVFEDGRFSSSPRRPDIADVPKAFATFSAHSAPLGLLYFDSTAHPVLRNSLLVSLHGSTKKELRRGYSIAQVSSHGEVRDFLLGFLTRDRTITGRPCGLHPWDGGLLVTDDHTGVVYWIGSRE